MKNSEKNNYLNDKDVQEKYLSDLKISESSLTQELKINNQKRREIARAVKKAIEDEIKAIEKKTKSKFNLTPEGIALSAEFKKNKGKLFFCFLDRTNEVSTYAGGRYIDIDFDNAKRIELDFNKSYNPFCVYDKKFSCPIPSKRNYIDIKIEAGEKI